jgi:uncharacterized protein YbaP (TraB family)
MNWKEKLRSLISAQEKNFKMIWKVEKAGRKSFLAGSAHFFLHSFKKTLVPYIQDARHVFFEGPLDEKSMDQVGRQGSKEGGATAIYEALDPPTIQKIKDHIRIQTPDPLSISLILPFASKSQDPLYAHFQNLRPWMAFFEIWSYIIKNRGWKYSVDLEALEIAQRLQKNVIFLETIEEQIAALEGIPLERFINFFKQIDHWDRFAKAHAELYLQGDLENMMKLNIEFPTRCPSIVDQRDPIMFNRMKEFFEQGEAIAFIGTIHLPGIQSMFQSEGYQVTHFLVGS